MMVRLGGVSENNSDHIWYVLVAHHGINRGLIGPDLLIKSGRDR
jgi:hypothetical protein